MPYGKVVNLNENGRRIDADGNPMPWREGSPQPSFEVFAAQHGGVAKAGSEVREGTDGRVPHVLFKDGTQAWGGTSVIKALKEARLKGEKFSLQACNVGEYVRTQDVPNEDGVLETREVLNDKGEPILQYAMFIAHVGEDDAITY